MKSSLPAGLLAAALAAVTLSAGVPAPRGERAVFAISDAVVVKNPPRFGANVHPPQMTHWNDEPWHNQWWLQPNPNPFYAQTKGFATGGGADHLEDRPSSQGGKGWGIGFYDVFRDGYFDGGTAAVYRLEDGRMRLVRESRIRSYKASETGENLAYFDAPGPEVKAGDLYVLTVERREIPPGSTRTMEGRASVLNGFQVLADQDEKGLVSAGVRTSIDASAPPGGGGGSLKLVVPPGVKDPVRVGYWLLSNQQPDWPRLREGAPYECRLWLKQQGMAAGKVEVRIASLKTETVDVGPDWKEYVIPFTGAPPTGSAERFDIGALEPGALWIDNVTICETGAVPPWAWYPEVVKALKDFRPSALRLWALQENRGFGRLLDHAIGPVIESDTEFEEYPGAKTTDAVGLHRQLELCEAVGADPWIITSTMFSLAEQKNLIEYLAGPAASPYGAKRAAWGRRAPWTDAFATINIELGNETWNGMFAPQGFSGNPEIYGALAELVFSTMKSSPHFRPKKFRFVVNGWAAQTERQWSYGARALEACPSADAVDIAYYTGGWDAVGLIQAEDEDAGWMNVLTFYHRMLRPRALAFDRVTQEIARERGRPAISMVYEAGPGYTLPAPGKFNRKEQEEGKSLAQAINSCDSFMANLRAGYGEQSFFLFRNAHYWSSHNRAWGEHIAWKALKMRNTLLEGDLVTAGEREMIFIDLPEAKADIVNQSNSADVRRTTFPAEPNVPLVQCYPFKKGGRWSFMLLSRRLRGETPVTLELPYEPKPEVRVYTLAADSPAAHNIDGEVVTVREETRGDFAQRYTLSLPPHSIVVLVNEAR